MKSEKNKIKHLQSLLLCLLISFNIWSLDPKKSINKYLINKWDRSDKLPSNSINSIAQTKDGVLWIGTSKGLIKYDGFEFIIVPLDKIINNKKIEINFLFSDKEDNLWIGCNFGLIKLEKGKLKKITLQKKLLMRNVKYIYEDMHKNIWLAVGRQYLNCYRNGKLSVFDESKKLPCKRISSIVEDKKGILWIGAYQNGLYRYQNGIFSNFKIKKISGKYSIYSIYESRDGNLWVGTNRGLISISSQTSVIYQDAEDTSSNSIYSILEDNEGNIWFGTGDGLNRIKKDLNGRIIIEKCLKGNHITSIFEDREKSLWIGTIGSGLIQLIDSTFTTYSTESNLPIGNLSLFKSKSNQIWIGSNNGTLYKFQKGRFSKFLSLEPFQTEDASISAIEEDHNNNLWLGTSQNGLYKITNKKVLNYSKSNGLKSNEILVVYCDSSNTIWIGTYNGGISCYNNGKLKTFTTSEGLISNTVFNVFEDRNKNIWLATSNGVQYIKKGGIKKEIITQYLNGIIATTIYEDKKGVFWFGTYFNGLKMMKNNKVLSISASDGLSSDYIFQITEDYLGNLWMSSGEGIFKVSLVDLERFADGNQSQVSSLLYNFSDGVKSEECSFSTRNSIIKVNNNELWFATKKGIAIVIPDNIKINKYSPLISITEVSFNKTPIALNLVNPSFQKVEECQFNFNVLTFISTEKIKIKYKLEGIDKDWRFHPPDEKRSINYKNLKPGNYKFKVIASNSNGVWNNKGDSFEFKIISQSHISLLLIIFFVLIILFLFLFIIYKFKINPANDENNKKDRYKNSLLDKKITTETLKKLKYLLGEKKIYLESEISLNLLAKKIEVSPHILSQVINESLKKNFWDLLNSYRIEDAKKLLLDPKHDFSILEIVYEVGFNNGSVFNRVFKKHTGQTPTQFKKKNSKN